MIAAKLIQPTKYYTRMMVSMLLNIVIGFLVPWVFGSLLYRKSPKIVILITPICIATAFTVNEWGFNYFWIFEPVYSNPSLATYPLNLGLYPVLGCFFVYFYLLKQHYAWGFIFVFSLFTTSIEALVLALGRVHYNHGWNLIGTFMICLIGFSVIYGYTRVLMRYGALSVESR